LFKEEQNHMRRPGLNLFVLLMASLALTVPLYAQADTSSRSVLLTVRGEMIGHPVEMSRADLERFSRRIVSATARDGKVKKFEGFALGEILEKAGVKFGEALHQDAAATYLLAEAADGYRVVFALPELEARTPDRMILIADRQDGNALPAAAGPLQIIALGDKGHGRWVRQVTSLTLILSPKKSH
jgi:hypothetical protein